MKHLRLHLIISGDKYMPYLKDSRAIAEYIEEYSTGYIDTERIEDEYRGCRARLATLPISALHAGSVNGNAISPQKQARYDRMPAATVPPIVVENKEVVDGNHRLRSALSRGDNTIRCYLIEEI